MAEFNNLNIRVDRSLKNDAEAVFDEFGLTMTTAVTMFLKQVVRERGIPFDLHLDKPNAETLAALEELKQMKAKKKSAKIFDDVEDLLADLKAGGDEV